MTTIEQLKNMPVGTKIGGFTKAIKTSKKKWQVEGQWFHQVQLMDKTGDMLADVNIGTYKPLIGGQEIRIIVAEIQETEDRNKPVLKLYIDQFEQVTQIGEPPDSMSFMGESEKVVRGKIKCWLVAAMLESGDSMVLVSEQIKDPLMKEIIDEIMKG